MSWGRGYLFSLLNKNTFVEKWSAKSVNDFDSRK